MHIYWTVCACRLRRIVSLRIIMPRHLQRLLRWRRGTGIMCHSTATIHGMSCSVVSNGSASSAVAVLAPLYPPLTSVQWHRQTTQFISNAGPTSCSSVSLNNNWSFAAKHDSKWVSNFAPSGVDSSPKTNQWRSWLTGHNSNNVSRFSCS